MVDEKTPLNKVDIDINNFRIQLKEYSIKQMEEYLKNYERYRKDFYKDNIACLLTYLVERMNAERKKECRIEGNERNYLGMFLTNGNLIVSGDAGIGVGYGMKGESILIEGNTGSASGYEMGGGLILIEKNAGRGVGTKMTDGKIICFGKIKEVSRHISGGMIYAGEFGVVPENVEKFTHSIYDIFKDSKKDEQLKKILKDYKGMFFPLANNDERQERFAEILGEDIMNVKMEFEKYSLNIW